jgi:hypothetical protein
MGRLTRNGNIVHDPRHSRTFQGDRLGCPVHIALTHRAGQIHHMIQCLYVDCIGWSRRTARRTLRENAATML